MTVIRISVLLVTSLFCDLPEAGPDIQLVAGQVEAATNPGDATLSEF